MISRELLIFQSEKRKPAELYQPIHYILSLGGKRIRPALALMACNLFSEDVMSSVKPALAIELFHNFTLIHDDIMDNAPLRRNQPTVHEKWDNNVAILSGDAMQIQAFQLMCEAPLGKLKTLLDIFNATAIEVCEGQQYDMNFAIRNDVSLEEYIQMIELKTSVLLAASLKIGAVCGDASENEAQKLYEFGRNLGIAFQIQDDYLDVYADQEIFGKTVGGDIAENKKTFLLIKALELAKGQHAVVLQNAINNHIFDTGEKIKQVRQVYDELNIPPITRKTISDYSDKAFGFLDLVQLPEERKIILRQTALELMNREK
jgi:geranylgeranyl diphosphate synthase type II